MLSIRRLALSSLLAVTLSCLPCWGGTVRTRAGKTYQGQIRFDSGKLIIACANGQAVTVEPANLAYADFTSPAEPPSPGPRVQQSRGQEQQSEPGNAGLTGEYFVADNLTGPGIVRIDPAIDWQLANQPPDPDIPADHFSARWTGKLLPPVTGAYSILVTADDGVRLWINEKPLVNEWHPGAGQSYTTALTLTAGEACDLRLEYYQITGPALLKLEWSAPNLPRQVIPTAQLRPATRPVPSDRGTGLQGWYYSDAELKQLNMIRTGEMVDFNWAQMPDPLVGQTNFSVRWLGQLEPKFTERYTFHFLADDGVRLWINNKAVIDDWRLAAQERSGSIDLAAGQKVELKAEFFQGPSVATAQLSWSSPHQPKQVIPLIRLYPPADVKLAAPAVRITAPLTPGPLPAPSGIGLFADASNRTGSVSKVEFLADGTSIGAATTRPYRVQWPSPPAGDHRILARATNDRGLTTTSQAVTLCIADGPVPPAPWSQRTIGDAGQSGQATCRGESFILKTSGQAMWIGEQAFHLVFQPLKGDGQIVARVADIQPRAQGAMAGVAILESFDLHTRQAAVGFVPETGWVYLRRTSGWEEPRFSERPGQAPGYVRLVRRGNVFTASVSADGATWQPLYSESIYLPPDTLIGLFATSGDKGALCTATFDHVSVRQAPPSAELPKGVQLAGGSVLAGEMHGVDPTGVRMALPDGSPRIIPAVLVTRILLRPMPATQLEGLPRNTPGLLRLSGDFLPGDIREVRDGQIRISSVLFGLKSVPVWEAAVIVLRGEPAPSSQAGPAYEIRAADGSVLQAPSLSMEKDRIQVDSPGGSLSFAAAELLEIRMRTER